jgi:hypothetical protein
MGGAVTEVESPEFDWGGDGSNLHEPIRAHVEAALLETEASYAPPLDQLLTLGYDVDDSPSEPRAATVPATQDHVPDLVRMTRDRALHTAPASSAEVWAPYHALMALQGLDFSDYVAELVTLFDLDHEAILEDGPTVLSRAGAVALEPLGGYLQDRTRWIGGRLAAMEALRELARSAPEIRDRIVAIYTDELRHADANDPIVNGFLVGDLVNLGAVEALPVIRQVFEQELVNYFVVGRWTDVLNQLGVDIDPDDALVRRDAEITAQVEAEAFEREVQDITGQVAEERRSHQRAKEKSKRKQAEASRKANRPKKKKRKK